MLPPDLLLVPRAVAERHANLMRWTVMPRGGHFAPCEEPGLLVEDIRELFRPPRLNPYAALPMRQGGSGRR